MKDICEVQSQDVMHNELRDGNHSDVLSGGHHISLLRSAGRCTRKGRRRGGRREVALGSVFFAGRSSPKPDA